MTKFVFSYIHIGCNMVYLSLIKNVSQFLDMTSKQVFKEIRRAKLRYVDRKYTLIISL